MAVKKNKKIHKLLNIRKGRKVTAVMTLGYPLVKYVNVPVRKERTVTWFE